MNIRIYWKIYRRAQRKLDLLRRINDKRLYTEQIKEEPTILSSLERKVFLQEQERRCRLMDEIISEMKSEGKW